MSLRRCLVVALAFAWSQTVAAMAAIEYLRIKSSSEQNKIMEPISDAFVARGYKKVPNWAELDYRVRDLIREKGYTYQRIEDVAEEAAIKAGMTK